MASSTVINELVWHFAGYLRLPPGDNFTVKILYEGASEGGVGQDGYGAVDHPLRMPDTHNLPGGHLDLPAIAPPEPLHWQHSPISKIHFPPHHDAHLPFAGPHPLGPLPVAEGGGGGGGGGGEEFQITVSYQPGGDQDLIDVRQINLMVNDNQVVDDNQINAPSTVVTMNNDHADNVLTFMEDKAANSIPPNLDLTTATTSDLKAFVDANDSQPLTTQANDAPYTFELGQYVNGAPVTDGSDPHQITNDLLNTVSDAITQAYAGPPALPTGDHSGDSIQNVSVGSNIEANNAVLTNLEGLSTSLAVLGNYYQTEAIVQTNVFAGMDQFAGNGTASIAMNTIENIADVQNQVPTLTSGGSGTTTSGLNWSVDVLNGNLLDIHSLVQTNYLTNNNVVYQTSYYGDSEIVAGSNSLVNSAQFQNLTADYDLIVVEGNYNQDDLIYQTNVLLDNNAVNFNGGGMASQSATGGGNSLVNDATIVDTGNHNYQQFNPDAMAVVQALESQAGTVDPNAVLSAFPNLFGNINILVVTGNFYDVNYISQTNIMSNSNVVQLNGSPASPSGATQSVSTGNDITLNAATILDGGSATSPYLQGNYYNDMILIQTNILGHEPKIAGQDPNQLVPELVAFTGPEATPHGQDGSGLWSANPQHHHDGFAGMLH
jgi:hypothetical protein